MMTTFCMEPKLRLVGKLGMLKQIRILFIQKFQYPWMARLNVIKNDNLQHLCGGTLISSKVFIIDTYIYK